MRLTQGQKQLKISGGATESVEAEDHILTLAPLEVGQCDLAVLEKFFFQA